MGWFEHGSTIIVVTPPEWRPEPGLREGAMVRMGAALMRRE